jgi:hypothetical protein
VAAALQESLHHHHTAAAFTAATSATEQYTQFASICQSFYAVEVALDAESAAAAAIAAAAAVTPFCMCLVHCIVDIRHSFMMANVWLIR